MKKETITIEDMLADYGLRLEVDAEREAVRLRGLAAPETPAEFKARAAQLRECAEMHRLAGRAYQACEGLRVERQSVLRATFAGTGLPANPLELLAMRAALLDDFDGLAGSEYLGAGEDMGEGTGPIGKAFAEVNAALHTLEPTTREAALAIRGAWNADADCGFSDHWDKGQVAAAERLLGGGGGE